MAAINLAQRTRRSSKLQATGNIREGSFGRTVNKWILLAL